VYDITRGTLARSNFEDTVTMPSWSADGRGIVFAAQRDTSEGLFSMPVDGTGPPERLTVTNNPAGASTFHQMAGRWRLRAAPVEPETSGFFRFGESGGPSPGSRRHSLRRHPDSRRRGAGSPTTRTNPVETKSTYSHFQDRAANG
jgi:hypothetical protein